MTKVFNPGLMKTNRRNVLRGSVLAGAAAMTGTAGLAGTRRAPLPKMQPPAPRFLVAEEQAQMAAPAADWPPSLSQSPGTIAE